MIPNIRIEPAAEAELVAAQDWYEERRKGLGRRFVDEAYDAMSRIQAMPSIGSPVPGVAAELEVRRVFVKQFPYAVVFVEVEECISIVAFAHMSRRPGYWKKRFG